MLREDSPRGRKHSGEVHHRDQDKVPGAQVAVNSLQLLEHEVKHRLQYKLVDVCTYIMYTLYTSVVVVVVVVVVVGVEGKNRNKLGACQLKKLNIVDWI